MRDRVSPADAQRFIRARIWFNREAVTETIMVGCDAHAYEQVSLIVLAGWDVGQFFDAWLADDRAALD